MTTSRIIKMYGDKPALYIFSICILFFGMGYLISNYTKPSFLIGDIIVLFLIVHIFDAIIKSCFRFIKDFKFIINLKLKEE